MLINGWIILDKPSGITSAHAVSKVKRILTSPYRGEVGALATGGGYALNKNTPSLTLPPLGGGKFRIGHAGTLDPLASGILPLALGEATKTVPFMMDAGKAYSFTVTWGEERDTDDIQGKVTASSDMRPTKQEIEAILPNFIGEIQQIPPNYSAIKVDGERAYDLARSGEVLELKARVVRVDSLVILNEVKDLCKDPSATPQDDNKTSFICHCGKGTYIRSLARDMGRALGCYGHISVLRRLKVGKFDENCAISLEKLEEMVHKGDLGFLQAVASALDDIPAVTVTNLEAEAIRRGQSVKLSITGSHKTVAAFLDGKLIAVCDAESGLVKPRRVFNL